MQNRWQAPPDSLTQIRMNYEEGSPELFKAIKERVHDEEDGLMKPRWGNKRAGEYGKENAFCFLDHVTVDGYEHLGLIERLVIVHRGEWLTDMEDPPPEEELEDLEEIERGREQEEYKNDPKNKNKRGTLSIEYHQDQVTQHVTTSEKRHDKKRRKKKHKKHLSKEERYYAGINEAPIPLPYETGGGGTTEDPILNLS